MRGVWCWLALGLVPFISGGANCTQFTHMSTIVAPRVLSPTPTLVEVANVVNGNTARVQSLYSADATISAPLTPSLRATLAVERPRRLRLRADTALTGAELDLGSNDQLFWLWAKRQQPPAVFYCRHDQFINSSARQMLPIEPEWLIEALGLTTVDPQAQPQGPFDIGGGRLRVQTQRMGPQGPVSKVLIIDATRGWVLEQHLYDQVGQHVASATSSNFMRDAATGAVLPRHIEIKYPAANFSISIDFRSLQVNTIAAANAQAFFEMPQYPGAPPVDLANPNFQAPPGAAAALPQASRDPQRF